MALITKEEIKSIAEKYYDRKSFSASDIASHYISDSTQYIINCDLAHL